MSDTNRWTIWWLKRDFRLADNPALLTALARPEPVLALYIIEPSSLSADESSPFHWAACCEAVQTLRGELRKRGGDLAVLRGEVRDVFQWLHARLEIAAVVSHEEIGVMRTYRRDLSVAKWFREAGIGWEELPQTGVFRRLRDRDDRGRLWQSWIRQGPLAAPRDAALRRLQVPEVVKQHQGTWQERVNLSELGLDLPEGAREQRQGVSEAAALQTLKSFLRQRGYGYQKNISSPNSAFEGGSRLSVHLAWGTVSIRRVFAATERRLSDLEKSRDADSAAWKQSLQAFRSRLNWRDHFIQRLETEPTMETQALNPAYDDLPCCDDPQRLQAWIQGETGFPLVDACIRCARTTGFLNFRMRALLTSVACHALRLRWSEIQAPMARWWADYEPGIHLAQVQMQAGVVGINTLRVYNPAKQFEDQDPQAEFVKRWIPELAGYSPEEIAAHQQQPLSGYLAPIVPWRESTAAMKQDYFTLKRKPETKRWADRVYQKHGSRMAPPARRRRA